MKLCTDFNCNFRSNCGQCLLTACVNENVQYVSVDTRRVKPDGTYEKIYVISENDLELGLRAALKEVYKEGYYQDITFNMLCRSLKEKLEGKSV